MHHFERWRAAIQNAQSVEEVLAILSDYVRCLPGDELNDLSLSYLRVLSNPTANVHDSALALLQEELKFKGQETVAALMREVSLTFTAASMRLAVFDGYQRHPADIKLFEAYDNARREEIFERDIPVSRPAANDHIGEND